MSRTDFAKEILLIAERVIAEKDSGRQVDPQRLEWAEAIVRANVPAPHQSRAPAERAA